MSYDHMQWTIIGIAVFISGLYAIRKLAPNAVHRLRTRVALWFLDPQSSAMERRIGRWLAPKPTSSGACGSSSCGGCSNTKSSY